ncbi:unnamed protein product, partial [Cuscuta epithymum]
MDDYGFDEDLKARVLEPRERLIAYLLSFNILPRSSDTHVLRRVDLYLMYKMINGLGEIEGIPLAPLIMTEMRSFGADLTNEEVEYTTEAQILRPSTMMS